jgi:putative FmdB family regulatory protein
MPIYEFECAECGNRFEELLSAGAEGSACPECGARARRRLSPVSPPSRQPRGAAVRSGESQRREGEAARQERLAETKRKRRSGEGRGQ